MSRATELAGSVAVAVAVCGLATIGLDRVNAVPAGLVAILAVAANAAWPRRPDPAERLRAIQLPVDTPVPPVPGVSTAAPTPIPAPPEPEPGLEPAPEPVLAIEPEPDPEPAAPMELGRYRRPPASVRQPQCPRCGRFTAARRPSSSTYGCEACGARWLVDPGAPWPTTVGHPGVEPSGGAAATSDEPHDPTSGGNHVPHNPIAPAQEHHHDL